jgi:hypothetical protein
MVSLAKWLPNQRAISNNRPTNQLIRVFTKMSLWPIIALLLTALALVVQLVFLRTEPTGTEMFMGP